MKKNVLIIISVLIFLGLGIAAYFVFGNNKPSGSTPMNNSVAINGFFDKNNLKEDKYLTHDIKNGILYESKIYVPKNLTKLSASEEWPEYRYSDDNYSVSLVFHNYADESYLKTFKSDMNFEKEDFYYIGKSSCSTYIYFENNVGLFQTLTLTYVDQNSDICNLNDDSYKNLLNNLNTSKINMDNYYDRATDGYYTGDILYTRYTNESNKYFVNLSYKVDANKYGTKYDDSKISPNLHLDKSSMQFYEGEITTDIASVQNQTRIDMHFSYILNLDLPKTAERDIEYALNQPAFKDVSLSDVNITYDSFDYNNKKINYYKIVSDNNNSHNERIAAYMELKNNNYYIITIYGGVGKTLTTDMIKEFLPTNITEN